MTKFDGKTCLITGAASGLGRATAFAAAAKGADLVLTDISEEALAIATENADSLMTPERRERITFRQGSLTDPIDGPVDLLLTNLPYLTPEQMRAALQARLDATPRPQAVLWQVVPTTSPQDERTTELFTVSAAPSAASRGTRTSCPSTTTSRTRRCACW